MAGFFEEVGKAIGNAGKAIEKGTQETGKTIEKGAQDIGKGVEQVVQNIGEEAEIATQNIGKEIEKGGQNIGREGEKAAHDLGNFFEKAGNDTVAQVGRSYDDVVELAEASYHFIENQVEGYALSISDAAHRVSEGKLIDAVWHAMTDPIRIAEQSTAEAVMESSLLNTLAASGASVYGGPAGAAAYAAWYAYKVTGNLDAAIRAGAIAWATSSLGKATKGIEGSGLDAAAKRTLASAAIGGAAVAAAGGSDEQVLAAFGRGAALGSAREVYKSVTNQTLEGKPATRAPELKETDGVRQAYATLPNGNLDITSMPRDISHVGMATSVEATDYWGKTETSGIMQDLAKIPYINDMAYFHDQWMALTDMQGLNVQITILPALVLTGMGSDGAQSDIGTNQVIDKEKQKG